MMGPQKRAVNAVRSGLPNMSEMEENVGADYLEHVFWGVLDDSCRHFRNPLSPEAARAIYVDKNKCPASGKQTGSHG